MKIAGHSVGNTFVFETALREDEVFLLYYIGPDYVGSLDFPIDQFRVYDHANEAEIGPLSAITSLNISLTLKEAHVRHLDVLNPVVNCVQHLKERTSFVFSCRSLAYARVQTFLWP